MKLSHHSSLHLLTVGIMAGLKMVATVHSNALESGTSTNSTSILAGGDTMAALQRMAAMHSTKVHEAHTPAPDTFPKADVVVELDGLAAMHSSA